MSTAENHALTDRQFMDLAKPSTTLSGRLRYNKILADAAYVHSLLATAAGSYTDAARHARQCVTLNRRIWAALESRSNMKKPTLLEDTDSSVDGASRATFDPLGSIRNEKGTPLVMSVTHDALCGADFWSLVPALYRGLMQHSQIFAAQGLLHEAIYVAEQAQKIASATKSVTLITDNASWRADCWAQSGRPDKAEPLLEALNTDAARKCLSLVGYQSAVARVHHWKGQYTEEITSYGVLDQLLQDLTSPVYVRGLDNFASEVSSLAEQMSKMTVETTETLPIKAVPTTRGRKPASKPAQRRVAKAAPRLRVQTGSEAAAETVTVVKPKVGGAVSSDTPSVEEQCSVLCAFQAGIMHRSVLANLLQDDIVAADRLLEQVERVQNGISQDSSHLWATFKTMLAHTFKQIADNIAVNTLTESTIAFPAVGLQERRMSDSLTSKRSAFVSSTASKSGRAKKQIQVDFTDTLRNARDRLMAAHASAASKGPNHMFQQISMALGHVTVLLSAVSGGELGRSLHPLYAAYMAGTEY
jgi:separase